MPDLTMNLFDLHLSEQETLIPKIVHTMETALPLPYDIPCKVDTGTGAGSSPWIADQTNVSKLT